MRRKTSDLPTRLYKYALRAPGTNAALVDAQLRLARAYRNELIELELRSRAAYRGARSAIAPIGELEQRIAELLGELHALRGRPANEARPRKLELSQTLRGLRAELRCELQRAQPGLRETARQIRADTLAALKLARKRSGLYWGTYQLVEQAVEQMRRAPADPRFERWDGRGSVGVQLSGGLAASELFGSDTRIRIDPIPADTFAYRGRSYRTFHRLTTLHLRIGSDAGGKPIWASWPLILDRPLPHDARVKSAWVTRRYLGTHLKWELCIALEAGSFLPPPRLDLQLTAASVSFGAQRTARGVRVACVCGSDGSRQEVLLPARFLERQTKCDSLSEQRESALAAARAALFAFVEQAPVPEWLAESTSELRSRAGSAALAALVRDWRSRRFGADAHAYLALEAWRKADRRLLEWQVNNRDKGYLHRREHFRLIAKDLAHRYGTLVLDDTDFRGPRGRRARAQAKPLGKQERRERALAACGELRSIIKYMADKHGCRVRVVPATAALGGCPQCGEAAGESEAVEAQHVCAQCGARWDPGESAARALLGRAAQLDAAE